MRAQIGAAELLAAVGRDEVDERPRARGLTRAGSTGQPAAALDRPSDYVVAALTAAARLVGVPMSYLAPDPRLLRAESLQFFVIDPNWVRGLQRGMLSTGNAQPVDDAELDALLDDLVPQPAPLTGLLLHSSLVSEYPTLTVRAWTGNLGTEDDPDDPANGATPVSLLRADRLTPSTLMVVFERVPDLVVIDEPHGSVRLGATTEPGGRPVARIRAGDASLVEVNGTPVDVPIPWRGAAIDRIVDVSMLAADLANALQTAGVAGFADPRTSPSGLAFQLLAPPTRQRYQRGVQR